MVRKKSQYHILVAQNFLSNITVDGANNDNDLRDLSSKQIFKNVSQKKVTSGFDSLNADESVLSLGTSASFNESIRQINEGIEEDSHHKVNFMIHSFKETPIKKPSFLRRIAKIMSSDDVIYSITASSSRAPILEEESFIKDEVKYIEYRSESQSSLNQYGFLKRLKSTITHVDRWYMCNENSGIPFAVFSYIPSNSDYIDPAISVFSTNTITKSKKNRSKSLFGSSDKMRNYPYNSVEELRPFTFRDSQDYISLAQMKRKRNPSPFFTLFEKPPVSFFKRDRKESHRLSEINDEVPFDITEMHQTRDSGSVEDKNEELIKDPETLVDYDPHIFDELAIGKRTIIRKNCYVGSTLHFSSVEKAKSAMNENFAEKYSHVQLTLSKMISLKREMLELAKTHSVDCHTLAVAYVYFEKIVEMGLISKSNRKCVAGVCLLVAMKMNDFSKTSIKSFIESAEDQLREQKSDLLDYELPLCTALKFKLVPPIEELQLHIDRLQFELM